MKLIPEARKAHKLWSVQAGSLTVAFAIVELINQALPLWSSVIPEGAFGVLTALTGTAALALRLIPQAGIHGE